MGVEGRPSSLPRQSSNEDTNASAEIVSSRLRVRRSASLDNDQGSALADSGAVHSRGSSEASELEGDAAGVAAAVQGSWFQRLDDTFLSPLFRISAVERERQNLIVSTFELQCAFKATGNNQGLAASNHS
jgi:hypothetical protein